MADHMLSDRDLDLIFRNARSYNRWTDTPVSNVQLEALWDLTRMGPTSANSLPARIIFCTSDESKEKLAACAGENNKVKITSAPVCAIIGMDMEFYELLPKLFPHTDARSWYVGDDGKNESLIEETAFRNSSLQGAYMIIAARSLGLDCGPMSGFDADAVDAAFWDGTSVRTNFICSIGHGSEEMLFARSPRLSFDEACEIR